METEIGDALFAHVARDGFTLSLMHECYSVVEGDCTSVMTTSLNVCL